MKRLIDTITSVWTGEDATIYITVNGDGLLIEIRQRGDGGTLYAKFIYPKEIAAILETEDGLAMFRSDLNLAMSRAVKAQEDASR